MWANLKTDEWESSTQLEAASGYDAATIIRIIKFLKRWNFVDVETWPELRVRRKPNHLSPTETFEALFELRRESPPLGVVAERVACRSCGGRELEFVQRNEVECVTCHEKQWYSVGREETLGDPGNADPDRKPSLVDRAFIRLGIHRKAFRANIPKETQYYWFHCAKCGKTSADYPHGHEKYLTCPTCNSGIRW